MARRLAQHRIDIRNIVCVRGRSRDRVDLAIISEGLLTRLLVLLLRLLAILFIYGAEVRRRLNVGIRVLVLVQRLLYFNVFSVF